MAAEFIGLHMLVTLHQPPARLRGVVTDIKSGSSLTLSNVWSADTNAWLQSVITIQVQNIANLVEVPAAQPPTTAHTPGQLHPTPSAAPIPSAIPPPSVPFTDPAIIAVGKPPTIARKQTSPNENGEQRPAPAPRAAKPAAALAESMEHLSVSGETPQASHKTAADPPTSTSAPASNPASLKKKGRRPRPAKAGRGPAAVEDTPAAGSTGRQTPLQGSTGWRQTPILEDTSSFQPYNSLRKSRGRRGNVLQPDNGWMSEDVTDVQEMGEFDFEGGLAKFDKHKLFDQMRKDDQIDEADRLVSHNRQPRPKPGTAGGKNLHYTENVLEPTPKATRGKGELPNDFWNSEADDAVENAAERLSGRELGSRQSSRRGESKMSTTRRSQSRKASTTLIPAGPGRAGSNGATPTVPHPGFVIMPSARRVETVSALQMLNLENIAHNELGFTEDMLTENAARGIAQVALSALADPAVRLRLGDSSSSSGPPPATVAILAGNNKSGIRAIAAARHLLNKNVTPLVCVVGLERGERSLLQGVKQQVSLLRNFGGTVFSKSDFFEHIRKLSVPIVTIDTPRGPLVPRPPAVTLILDALLGLATPFDELRTGEQATVYELIEWANRNEAFALAVDLPTGVDPSTGNISVVDGNRLHLRPRYVVAMGAPKKGLLEYVSSVGSVEEGNEAPPQMFLADIGLGPAVWKRAGTKIRRGIDFGDRWVMEMKLKGTASAN